MEDKDEQPLGVKGLLGLALDGTDGHTRISRGPLFYLFGGSKATHERMQVFAVKFSQQVDERGQRIQDLSKRELHEILEKAREESE